MTSLKLVALLGVALILETIYMCKNIENKNLKKYIIILSSLLLGWLILRVIKYSLVHNYYIDIAFWYLYYFPILFSATTFMCICTWNNKNKRHIKTIKCLSFIGSSILFILVITNNIHNLVFNFDLNNPNCASEYTYGFVYYICFLWIFLNLAFSIVTAIKESKGFYRLQKFIILCLIFILVFMYAFGYAKYYTMYTLFIKDFTVIYIVCYMLALIILVYKEKYRNVLEEQLYTEVEDFIKSKTILINKKIDNLSLSTNVKKELSYIKVLVSYCKRKSNLVIIGKDKGSLTSSELKLFIDEAIQDASNL